MNIYKITTEEKITFIASESLIKAVLFYYEDCQETEVDQADNIVEIPRGEWSEHTFGNHDFDEDCPVDEDNWQNKTFEEFMVDVKYTQHICDDQLY